MDYYSVWEGDRLLGLIFNVDYEEDKQGLSMFTLQELINHEDFINLYDLQSERDTRNNILYIKCTKSGKYLNPTDENSFGEFNAPEMVLFFKRGGK